jgi:hypothetical protein
MCSDAIRPRIWSGVTCCMIVFRKTAEITSAAPATASSPSAGQNSAPGISPKAAIDPPHTTTDTITAAPCRRTCSTQPLESAASSAPTAGAA